MKDSYIAAMDSVRMTENCRTKIKAALAEREAAGHRKRARMRTGVVMTAVMCLLVGSALAVTYRAGVLEAFFRGNGEHLKPYIQAETSQAQNEHYRLTLEESLYDGRMVYAVMYLEGLDAEHQVMVSKAGGFDCSNWFEQTVTENDRLGGIENQPIGPSGQGMRWKVILDLDRWEGFTGTGLQFWLDEMGEKHAITIPLDTPVEAVALEVHQKVPILQEEDWWEELTNIVLTPISITLTIQAHHAHDPHFCVPTTLDYSLRRTDETLLSGQKLSANGESQVVEETEDTYTVEVYNRFQEPQDLKQIKSILFGTTEILLDGSLVQEIAQLED